MPNQSVSGPFWAAGGAAASGISQALILAAAARLAGVEALGRYAFAVAVVAPVMLTARLQLRTVAATQRDRDRGAPVFLGTRAAASGIAATLLAGGSWFAADGGIAALITLLALARALEDLAEVSWGLHPGHRARGTPGASDPYRLCWP